MNLRSRLQIDATLREPPERAAALAKLRADIFSTIRSGAGRQRGADASARPCPVESASGQGTQAGPAAAFLNTLSPDKRAEYSKRMAEIDAATPAGPRATVKDMVDHIDYAVKLIGIDHVGIASDFDGGGGVDGWNSAAESFNVTLELVRRGYTEEQIGKLWSGNLLRVWEEVDAVARTLQKASK